MTPREHHESKAQTTVMLCVLLAVLLVGGFVVLMALGRSGSLSVPGALVVGLVLTGIVAAGLMLAFQYETAPTRLTCPHCGHRVYSNEPWVCGCGTAYPRSEKEPKSFLDTECRTCSRQPETLWCPNCEKPIMLGAVREENPRLWAKLAAFTYQGDLPPPSRTDELQSEKAELVHEEEVYHQKLRVVMAADALDRFQKDRATRNESQKERIRRLFDEYIGRRLTVAQIERDLIREAEESISDPTERDWMISNIREVRERIRRDDYEMAE